MMVALHVAHADPISRHQARATVQGVGNSSAQQLQAGGQLSEAP